MLLTPRFDGSAHAEQDGNTYYYVQTERGVEFERRKTADPNELLFWFVQDLTSEIARDWEMDHRVASQDRRRMWFNKHIELLRDIDESWANLQETYYNDVLAKHPDDDLASDRVNYFVNLQNYGIEHDEAWQHAVARCQEPKVT